MDTFPESGRLIQRLLSSNDPFMHAHMHRPGTARMQKPLNSCNTETAMTSFNQRIQSSKQTGVVQVTKRLTMSAQQFWTQAMFQEPCLASESFQVSAASGAPDRDTGLTPLHRRLNREESLVADQREECPGDK